MPTLEDHLKIYHPNKLKDLLDKYRHPNTQKLADGGTILTPEELVNASEMHSEPQDFIKRYLDKNNTARPDLDQSLLDQELANELKTSKQQKMPTANSEPYYPEGTKRPWELEAEKEAFKTKNAVSRNPIGEVKSGTLIGSPTTTEGVPIGKSYIPNSDVAIRPSTSIANNTEVPILSKAQTLLNGLGTGGMNAAGMGLGMGALQEGLKDPESATSKLKQLYDIPDDNFLKLQGISTNNNIKLPSNKNSALIGDQVPGAIRGPYDPNEKQSDEPPIQETLASAELPDNFDIEESPSSIQEPSQAKKILDAFKLIQDSHGEGLRSAQDVSNKNQLYANLSKAANQFSAGAIGGHGVAPAKYDNSTLEDLLKSSQTPIQQYEQQVTNEKYDVNSEYSNALKQALTPMFEKAGISKEQLQNMNGASLEKVAPWITQQVKAEEMKKWNLQLANIRKENQEDLREKTQAGRALTQAGKMIQTSGGNTGTQLRNRIAQSGNIFSTLGIDADVTKEEINQIPLEKLDKAKKLQVVESAIELNKMLSGSGVPAASTLDKLLLKSGKNSATDVVDWMQNTQTPREQGQYLKDILNIATNSRDTAKKQLTGFNQDLLPSLALVKKHYPGDYQNLIKTNRLMDVDEYQQALEEDKKTKEANKIASKILSPDKLSAYATQHSMSEDEALKWLTSQGYTLGK